MVSKAPSRKIGARAVVHSAHDRGGFGIKRERTQSRRIDAVATFRSALAPETLRPALARRAAKITKRIGLDA